MSEHLSAEQINRYISRELSPKDLVRLDDHLTVCDVCMRETAEASEKTIKAIQGVLFSGVDDDHLSYEQMSAFVDDDLDNATREIVDVHRSVCSVCTSEIDDLRRLRAALTSEREPSVAAIAQSHRGPGSWMDRLMSSPFWKAAIPAAAILLLAAVVWIWTAGRNAEQPLARVDDPTNRTTANDLAISNSVNNSDVNSTPPTQRDALKRSDESGLLALDEAGKIVGLARPVEIPQDARQLRSGTGVLMGGSGRGITFKLISPVGRVIESPRPKFNWLPLKGADHYNVGIFDENFKQVALSPELKTTSWAPNIALGRGRVYQWQVTATRNGEEIKSPERPAPDVKFKVVDMRHFDEIQKARRVLANSALVMAIAYANAGMLEEADRALQAFLKKNPDSEVARKLLTKIKAAR